jgi:hypothetical protein
MSAETISSHDSMAELISFASDSGSRDFYHQLSDDEIALLGQG